ncbi:hypothetical protein [Sphingobium olei]|uniref:Uncharacterized protein n=1 Tax=Sphingobium olei TaxID=420955 RepID=A0ABW3P949_9SPHN
MSKEVVDAKGDEPTGDGLLYQFKLAAAAAKPTVASGQLSVPDTARQRAFMEAGFALILARCNGYILAKADRQRGVNVTRDAFAPITALATGIVALVSSGESVDSDVLTALSLGTTAASAGFRIYEQRFLFGAENVNSVRRLVLKALTDNADEALRKTDEVAKQIAAEKARGGAQQNREALSYSQAVIYLINNQSICSPGHILELVNGAISAGKIESISSTDSKPAAPAKPEDGGQAAAGGGGAGAGGGGGGAALPAAGAGQPGAGAAQPGAGNPPAEGAQPPPPPAPAGSLNVVTTTVAPS